MGGGNELHERGVAAADAGDRAAAVVLWFRAMDGGSGDAGVRLARIAERVGDAGEVAAWGEALVAAGDTDSLLRLSRLCATRGDKDGLGAWLVVAARHDDPEGLCELGLWRHANYQADGRHYLKRAARLGHGYAAYRLGLSQLQHGRRRAARRWWAIAAGHGRAEATDALEVSDALRRPRSARRAGAGGGDDAGKDPAWWLDALRDRDSDAVYIYAKVESQHLKRQANDRAAKDPTGGPTWRRAAALGDRVVYWCLGCLAVRRGRLGEAWLWLAAGYLVLPATSRPGQQIPGRCRISSSATACSAALRSVIDNSPRWVHPGCRSASRERGRAAVVEVVQR